VWTLWTPHRPSGMPPAAMPLIGLGTSGVGVHPDRGDLKRLLLGVSSGAGPLICCCEQRRTIPTCFSACRTVSCAPCMSVCSAKSSTQCWRVQSDNGHR
jgi:hypothetical protein